MVLTISDWLRRKKLDLGLFNRIVFEEARSQDDCKIVGDKAFCICVTPEFVSLEEFNSKERAHQYFVAKYMEGFARFDQHFNLALSIRITID